MSNRKNINTKVNTTQPVFDIAIVGGGLVGSSLACALSKPLLNLHLKIALIDKFAASFHREDTDHARALALSLPSISCLKAIGIWQKMLRNVEDAQNLVEPIKAVHVSSKGHFGAAHIRSESQGLSELGFVVNADVLNKVIVEAAAGLSNVTLYRPAEILQLEEQCSNGKFSEVDDGLVNFAKPDLFHWRVTLNTGEEILARLIVAADGADSFIRSQQGIGVQVYDYQEDAIVTNVQLSYSHEGVAYERFLKEGCIALLPFGDKRAKCVWVVPKEQSEKFLTMSETEFLMNIQSIFGYRLGKILAHSKRIKFPLKSISAESIYGRGFVLIGNAANTLHPVAAQGFNLGLRDVGTLVDVLIEAKKIDSREAGTLGGSGFDIGSVEILREYAERRRADHIATRQFTHFLTQSNRGLSLGILASEFISSVKNKVVLQGLGRRAGLPSLCR